MRRRRRGSKRRTQLLRASKILVSLGASVNLTLASGGERYGHFRSGGEGVRADPIDGPSPRLWAGHRQGREPDTRCVAMHVFLLVR